MTERTTDIGALARLCYDNHVLFLAEEEQPALRIVETVLLSLHSLLEYDAHSLDQRLLTLACDRRTPYVMHYGNTVIGPTMRQILERCQADARRAQVHTHIYHGNSTRADLMLENVERAIEVSQVVTAMATCKRVGERSMASVIKDYGSAFTHYIRMETVKSVPYKVDLYVDEHPPVRLDYRGLFVQ